MFQRGRNRLLLALTLTVVLALAWAPPAQATGWTDWREEGRELAAGLVTRVLDRLGLAPHPGSTMTKCGDSDHGGSIDPNGCPKTTSGPRGSSSRTPGNVPGVPFRHALVPQ